MYNWNWEIIYQNKLVFLEGAITTLILTLLAVMAGTLLAVLLVFLKKSKYFLLALLAKVYIEIFRSLPILVLIIWIYYVLPIFLNWRIGGFSAAVIAISLHLSAFAAETIKAGLSAVPKNQSESGYALGLSSFQVLLYIIIPQSFKTIIPNLLGLYINELKNSSLASIIAVDELLHRSNVLISNTYRPLEIYTAMAVVYLILILPLVYLIRLVEKYYFKSDVPIKWIDYGPDN